MGLVGPVVGRALCRGSYELRKTLGSLPSDGWGSVPTPLVVWLEVSQHLRLQAVGRGQVSVQ